MVKEVHTAILLATATFFSGTAWQPVVNAMHKLDLAFNPAALGTLVRLSMRLVVVADAVDPCLLPLLPPFTLAQRDVVAWPTARGSRGACLVVA